MVTFGNAIRESEPSTTEFFRLYRQRDAISLSTKMKRWGLLFDREEVALPKMVSAFLSCFQKSRCKRWSLVTGGRKPRNLKIKLLFFKI